MQGWFSLRFVEDKLLELLCMLVWCTGAWGLGDLAGIS